MEFPNLNRQALSEWIEGNGPYQDVVCSSRIRLARNLKEFPFPRRLNGEGQKQIVKKVDAVLGQDAVIKELGKLRTVMLKDLPAIQRQVFVEKHVISPQQADVSGDWAKAVVLRDDEAVAIMVNEEDHLRIQVLLPGLQLVEAFRLASKVDSTIEAVIPYAYDNKFGYLTSCPTNAGTGLRASVMVHLPGLAMTQQIGKILRAFSQVGLAVRGSYGEGTDTKGNLYQVSNQITLGRSEMDIIKALSGITKKLMEQERATRDFLMENRDTGIRLTDRIYRSLGILSYARIIPSGEALGYLSDIRMGIDMGLIKDIEAKTINELTVLIRPAYIEYMVGENLSGEERDVARAEFIRRTLKGKEKLDGGVN